MSALPHVSPKSKIGDEMRLFCLLLSIGSIFGTGCSMFILGSGKQLYELETRKDVLKAFGEPEQTSNDGPLIDELTTHRKIAHPNAGFMAMTLRATFGLSEIVAFPWALFTTAQQMILGQQLRVEYDEAGQVTMIYHDGQLVVEERAVAASWDKESVENYAQLSVGGKSHAIQGINLPEIPVINEPETK